MCIYIYVNVYMFIVYLCDLTTRGTLMFLSGHASNLNTPEHLEASNPQIHHCCMFFCIFGGVPHAEGWRVPNGRFNRTPSKKKKDLIFALDKGLIPRGVR